MISAWLLLSSSVMAFAIFLPLLLSGGEMEVHEHSVVVRWTEFAVSIGGTALGIVGAVKGER